MRRMHGLDQSSTSGPRVVGARLDRDRDASYIFCRRGDGRRAAGAPNPSTERVFAVRPLPGAAPGRAAPQ